MQLEPGNEVIFGNQTFRWDGSDLVASATKTEFTLYADGLTTMRRAAANACSTTSPSSWSPPGLAPR